jgi:hypothetical protein
MSGLGDLLSVKSIKLPRSVKELGRPIHFEAVGQVLLGLPPQGRMFR